MPLISFRIQRGSDGNTDYESTLKNWSRNLEYLFNRKLDNANISSTTLTLGSNQVKASNIDFGTGADQVDASDMPILDASSYYSGGTIELALSQIGSTILNIPAENIKITDASSYFTSTSVEGALSEIGEKFSQVMHTTEGGLAIRLINRTGTNTVKGSLVSASTAYENAFHLQDNTYDSIGVVYEDGIADGSYTWVVVSGIASVLLQNNTEAIVGNWARASTDDGRVLVTTASTSVSALATAEHFREVGHCIQNITASTNEQTARIVLHFN